MVGEALRVSRRQTIQLFQSVIHTLGVCEECRGWEAVKLARQSGQFGRNKTHQPPWQQDAAERPHPVPLPLPLVLHYGKKLQRSRVVLNEAVFSDPDAQARVAIELYPISDHRASDSRERRPRHGL